MVARVARRILIMGLVGLVLTAPVAAQTMASSTVRLDAPDRLVVAAGTPVVANLTVTAGFQGTVCAVPSTVRVVLTAHDVPPGVAVTIDPPSYALPVASAAYTDETAYEASETSNLTVEGTAPADATAIAITATLESPSDSCQPSVPPATTTENITVVSASSSGAAGEPADVPAGPGSGASDRATRVPGPAIVPLIAVVLLVVAARRRSRP